MKMFILTILLFHLKFQITNKIEYNEWLSQRM